MYAIGHCSTVGLNYAFDLLQRMRFVLPFSVLLMSACLKVVILLNTCYKPVHILSFAHALMVSLVEFVLFALAIALFIPFAPRISTTSSALTRLYLALLFPESFRVVALVLHTFDSEPSLLLLLGILIAAIQFVSFQSCMLHPFSQRMIWFCMLVGMMAKVVGKLWFYKPSDVWLLGAFT